MRYGRFAGVWIVSVWIAAGASWAGTSSPATQPEEGNTEQTSRHADIDHDTGKRLSGAMKALGENRYDDARVILSHINPARLNAYETGRVEQLHASIYQAEGDYAAARKHLLNAVASAGLTQDEASTVRFQIAQFSLAQQNWRQGIKDLNQWFAHAAAPTSAAYYLLAAAHYQLQDYASALKPAQKAVELSDTPQENWLQLLLALRIMREEYDQAIPVLKRLVSTYPAKKMYWTQLSSVYAALGQYPDATATMQLAYEGGLLTEDQEIRRLAELLIHNGIPRRAAEILGEAIEEQNRFQSDAKTHELLGNCWVAAREYKKALGPLEQAAKLADDGEAYVRLAEVHVQLEDWNEATEALKRGIEKGNLQNTGHAQLLLGIAFYNRKNSDAARSWLEQALADETSRSQAAAWLKQIDVDTTSHS